jgi:hypothetical protein
MIFDERWKVNCPVFLVFGLASFVGIIFGFYFVRDPPSPLQTTGDPRRSLWTDELVST